MTLRWPTVDDLLEVALDQADNTARCDLVIERAFLGGVICSSAEVIQRLWPLLGPRDFFDQLHAAIWAASLRLRATGRVTIENVANDAARMPGARDRVCELARSFVAGEDELDFLLRSAATIKLASARRAAARIRSHRRAS